MKSGKLGLGRLFRGGLAEFGFGFTILLVDEIQHLGDVFLFGEKKRSVAVVAGNSPLSGLLAISVEPKEGCGVCTSSGTVGHSLSLGKADAAMVIAGNCALADAAATRLGNLVQTPDSLDGPLEEICAIPGVEGALVIAGDRVGIKGSILLQPIRGAVSG